MKKAVTAKAPRKKSTRKRAASTAAPTRTASGSNPSPSDNHHDKNPKSGSVDLMERRGLPKPASGTGLPKTVVLRDEPFTVAQLRKVKSELTRKDLNHYKRLLLEKRAELLGDVESLGSDTRDQGGGNLSHMPLHMADIGSDNYEQEFTLGLMESEAKLLREINEALQRMAQGIYGICVESGKPIGKARLDAKPWAKFSIHVARELERLGKL